MHVTYEGKIFTYLFFTTPLCVFLAKNDLLLKGKKNIFCVSHTLSFMPTTPFIPVKLILPIGKVKVLKIFGFKRIKQTKQTS